MRLWPWGERWKELDKALGESFSKVRSDTALLFSWISYLREKDKVNDSRNERTSYFLGKISSEVGDLRAEVESLREELRKQGQVRTPERTSQGQVKDMSPKSITARARPVLSGTPGLRGSQSELLEVLYAADRPLGYGELAQRLSKTEKSIRNLIYELRAAGVGVLDKPIGAREKGFFLDAETKIEVSGR